MANQSEIQKYNDFPDYSQEYYPEDKRIRRMIGLRDFSAPLQDLDDSERMIWFRDIKNRKPLDKSVFVGFRRIKRPNR